MNSEELKRCITNKLSESKKELHKIELENLSDKKTKNLVENYNKYVEILTSNSFAKKLEDISQSNVDRITEYLSSYDSLCNKINQKQKDEIKEATATKKMAIERIKSLHKKFKQGINSNKKIKAKISKDKIKNLDSNMKKFTNQLKNVKYIIKSLKGSIVSSKEIVCIKKFKFVPKILDAISEKLTRVKTFLSEFHNKGYFSKKFNLRRLTDALTGSKNSVRILFNQINAIHHAVDPKTNNMYDGLANLFGGEVDAEDIPEKLTFYSVKEEEEKIDNFFTFLNKEALRVVRKIHHKTNLFLPEQPKTQSDINKIKKIDENQIKSLVDENRKLFKDTTVIEQKMAALGLNENFKKALVNLYEIICCKKICSVSIGDFAKTGAGGIRDAATWGAIGGLVMGFGGLGIIYGAVKLAEIAIFTSSFVFGLGVIGFAVCVIGFVIVACCGWTANS